MFISVAPVLIIVLLSLLVTRVATVALTMTGLSRQSARFQARSALTGSGFTTDESEKVVHHPVRRRIVMLLMLVGSSTIVAAIASLMIGFARQREQAGTGDLALNLVVLIIGLAALLWLFSTERVDRWLQRVIQRALRRYTDLDVRDYAALLHVHGSYAISELEVEETDWLADHTLAELSLADEGVLVLGVQRKHDYLGAPRGDTRIRAGDVLILYGPAPRLEDLDVRPAGPEGEQARQQAVVDQRVRDVRQQQVEETADGR